MNIDILLKEQDNIILFESKSAFRDAINKIKNWTWNKAKDKIQKSFRYVVSFAKTHNVEKELLFIINKLLGNGTYTNLNQLNKLSLKEGILLEDNSFWKEMVNNLYGAMSFYPLLEALLELDKLVKNQGGADIKYVLSYALIWVLIVTGKVSISKIKANLNKKKKNKPDKIGTAYKNMYALGDK